VENNSPAPRKKTKQSKLGQSLPGEHFFWQWIFFVEKHYLKLYDDY